MVSLPARGTALSRITGCPTAGPPTDGLWMDQDIRDGGGRETISPGQLPSPWGPGPGRGNDQMSLKKIQPTNGGSVVLNAPS